MVIQCNHCGERILICEANILLSKSDIQDERFEFCEKCYLEFKKWVFNERGTKKT